MGIEDLPTPTGAVHAQVHYLDPDGYTHIGILLSEHPTLLEETSIWPLAPYVDIGISKNDGYCVRVDWDEPYDNESDQWVPLKHVHLISDTLELIAQRMEKCGGDRQPFEDAGLLRTLAQHHGSHRDSLGRMVGHV